MQADLRLCWLHIPHCWKSHALALIIVGFIEIALMYSNLSSPQKNCKVHEESISSQCGVILLSMIALSCFL